MNTTSSQPWAYTAPQSWKYAGFWVRVAALFIDYLFALLITVIYVVALAILDLDTDKNPERTALIGLISMALIFTYFVFFTGGKWQGTPGKRICNLRVIGKDGNNVGFIRSFVRVVGYGISFLLFCIGFLLAGVTREKTALHDLIASTRVVYGKVSV